MLSVFNHKFQVKGALTGITTHVEIVQGKDDEETKGTCTPGTQQCKPKLNNRLLLISALDKNSDQAQRHSAFIHSALRRLS